jgi:hypothetical protein
MGVLWRRGICDGSCTGFFDSGENGEQSSQTSWSSTNPGHIVSFAIKQIFNTMEEREPKSEDEGRITLPIHTEPN